LNDIKFYIKFLCSVPLEQQTKFIIAQLLGEKGEGDWKVKGKMGKRHEVLKG
jgi:hypothetical protein